ncbi:LysR family transcriptional regulator [Kitasatospora cineracea]|uniref:DNA-binding transcriptional LysR family regulator n=1 Tax=Kitasatospora cineracea TaxID=88074 RepID=A0A8G1UL59_9ACTN|nr:LysR family transcriptional regulator [Kitasatospora cineracea]ROR45868.1 DNA-binding transcriptional LysR family regulator [Kitasatospora cineracea]
MELRHLRTFEAVARTLSMTGAARELHYAQSSVSDQVQSLERELGVELVDRSQRRIRLTAQGEVLASYTGRILGLVEEARTAVVRPAPELALGALETLSRHLLPGVLASYRTRHPETRVRVSQSNRGELHGAVRRGELDLCLTFGTPPNVPLNISPNISPGAPPNARSDSRPDAPGLRAETLAEEPLVVIVPPGHRLAARGRADLAELAAEPFLATQRGCGFREMYDTAFGGTSASADAATAVAVAAATATAVVTAAVGPEPVAEVDSIDTLGACVAAGMGCALLPLLAVRHRADRGEVAVVEVGDAELRTAITMTWLERSPANPALTGFQDALRRQLSA